MAADLVEVGIVAVSYTHLDVYKRQAQARLVELDAVMEVIASPREHRLLAAVPGLLAERHLHLHRQAIASRDAHDLQAQATPAGDAWPHVLRKDMQDLLLAELDVRFMPIEGLLAALRAH